MRDIPFPPPLNRVDDITITRPPIPNQPYRHTRDKGITFYQFINIILDLQAIIDKRELKEIFVLFDRDADGFINENDARESIKIFEKEFGDIYGDDVKVQEMLKDLLNGGGGKRP